MLGILKKRSYCWLLFVVTFLFFGEARGQVPTYLTGQITGRKFEAGSFIGLGTGNAGVSAPMLTHAWGCGLLGTQTNEFRFYYNTSANFSAGAPATVTAARSLGLLGVLGSGGDAYIQFRNTGNATIAASTPTYFRLNDRPTAGGISLNVGGILGLAELQSINGVAYSGAGNYTLNTATTNLSCSNPYNGNENPGAITGTSTTQLLIDATGNWFAKVTPSAAYNSVRLNVAYPEDKLLLLDLAALANLNASINVKVHSAFTQTDGGPCNLSPQFTSPGEVLGGVTLTPAAVTAGLGINLSTLVANPQYAINGNNGDFSSFSSGVANVGVANTVAQSLYFDHSSTVEDGIRVQLGVQQSLIDLGVLGRSAIKFKAYSGDNLVYNESLATLSTLLQLNLLNLVTINGSTHKKVDITFKPGVIFDRFEISFDQGIAAVGVLGDALRIYEVSMAPSLPNITLQPTDALSTNICEGNDASFSVTATASPGGVVSSYQWQYLAAGSWVDIPSGSASTLNLTSVTNAMNNRWYRAKISGGNASCPQDIYSNEAQLTVKPRAQATDIDAPGTTICLGLSTTLTCNSLTIASPIFKWYANANLTGLLATGSSYNVTPTTTTSYWVTVEGAATCQNAPSTAKQVTVTVTPHPPPAITITSN